jgi:hypothetical protein
VGLLAPQVAQGQYRAAAALLQHHRAAPSPFHYRGEQPAITTEGGILAGFLTEA